MENKTMPNAPVTTAIRMILRISAPLFEPRSSRVNITRRSLSNGRRFWHEDREPAADYADYADADVRPSGQLASLHPRNSRNPRLVQQRYRQAGTESRELDAPLPVAWRGTLRRRGRAP